MIDVAIIGAGPYGLSIAAHAKARGLEFRIFGSPMLTWLTHMPQGMMLKSEGFASSLYDPNAEFTLKHYCRQQNIPYADTGSPVHLETFSAYGLAFQKRFVPELENTQVVSLQRSDGAFRLVLGNGETLLAQRVVVAVGLSYFDFTPPILCGFPQELVTHSSLHTTLEHFKGRKIAVIGGGASAIDIAALLHRVGASTFVIARKPVIRFHDPPDKTAPPLWKRLRTPPTGIGSGWKLYFCANAPSIFRRMPENFRLATVGRVLGPAPGWFMKEAVMGKVPLRLGTIITEASARKDSMDLHLTDDAGGRATVSADHVISATGYRVSLRRLRFLCPDVMASVQSVQDTPILSSNFESSVPGLYFVGASAANSFGPLLRFAFGAKFAATALSSHLAKSKPRNRIHALNTQ